MAGIRREFVRGGRAPGKVLQVGRSLEARVELSINLELLFFEAGDRFTDRVRACADAGFAYAEMWHWRNKNIDALRKTFTQTGVELVTIVAEPRVDLADRRLHDGFLKGFCASCDTADRLGCGTVVVTSGHELPATDLGSQRQAVVDVLSEAGEIAGRHGIVLALENVNSRIDHPGTLLDTSAACISVVKDVASSHVRLLLDLYHALVMGESLDDVAVDPDVITYVQIADVPGRGEPGSGSIDWRDQLVALQGLGYRGPVGLECRPTRDTLTSVEYIRTLAGAL